MAELFAAFGINWKLLLAQGFNFGVLLLALWWFLYRPVLAMLDERRAVMEKGVQDAEAAASKLASADGEGKEIVTKASQAADSLLAAARTRAEEKSTSIVEEARAKAEAEIRDARARAEAEAEAIRHAGEKEIARAAVLAAEKILRKA